MNLEEAIETLNHLRKQTQPGEEQDELDALNLGIEALKAIQQLKEWGIIFNTHKLPGETDD